MSVCKPVLTEELGISRAALGTVDTAMLGAYALGQIFLGELSRFLTPRQMLTLAFLASGVATGLVGASAGAAGMALWSGVGGFAAACVNPLLVLFVADLFPASVRASVVGLWQTSAQFGGIAANNVAALVLGQKGWRAVFFASGVLVASFAPAINLAVKPQDNNNQPSLKAPPPPPPPPLQLSPPPLDPVVAGGEEDSAPPPTLSTASAAAAASSSVGDGDETAQVPGSEVDMSTVADALESGRGDAEVEEAAAALPTPPPPPPLPPGVAAAPPVKSLPPPSALEVVSLPGVAATATSYALVKMARYCLMLWLPTFFKEKVGLSAASAGAMASLFDAGGVAGGVFAGVATDAFAKGRMLAVSTVFCVLGSAGFAAWALLVAKAAGGGGAGGAAEAAASAAAAAAASATAEATTAAAVAAATEAAVAGAGLGGSGSSPLVLLHCIAMVGCGFLVAGPDGILGGAASKNMCDYNGLTGKAGKRWAPAVSGLVNGVASVGVIAMSAGTANLVGAVGWGGLFVLLAAMMAAAAAVHLPGVAVEAAHFNAKKDQSV